MQIQRLLTHKTGILLFLKGTGDGLVVWMWNHCLKKAKRTFGHFYLPSAFSYILVSKVQRQLL